MPSIPGIWMSIRMRSKGWEPMSSRADGPESAMVRSRFHGLHMASSPSGSGACPPHTTCACPPCWLPRFLRQQGCLFRLEDGKVSVKLNSDPLPSSLSMVRSASIRLRMRTTMPSPQTGSTELTGNSRNGPVERLLDQVAVLVGDADARVPDGPVRWASLPFRSHSTVSVTSPCW